MNKQDFTLTCPRCGSNEITATEDRHSCQACCATGSPSIGNFIPEILEKNNALKKVQVDKFVHAMEREGIWPASHQTTCPTCAQQCGLDPMVCGLNRALQEALSDTRPWWVRTCSSIILGAALTLAATPATADTSWYNFQTQAFETGAVPDRMEKYIPQDQASQGLYKLLRLKGLTPAESAIGVLQAGVRQQLGDQK